MGYLLGFRVIGGKPSKVPDFLSGDIDWTRVEIHVRAFRNLRSVLDAVM